MIRTKQESDYRIKTLGLNRMLEGRFTNKSSEGQLEKFLKEHEYEFYNIRDKSSSMGKFLYKLTADESIKESKNYQSFAIYESLAEADKTLILQGDVEIDKNFIMRASLSNVKGISNRIAMQNPVYNLYNYDLKENTEPSIRGLSKVIDYISSHELIEMVVEFSLFEIPVGINKEKILIWELRNY